MARWLVVDVAGVGGPFLLDAWCRIGVCYESKEVDMKLTGKGYIQNGEGIFITSTGECYDYHDGRLTLTSRPIQADDPTHDGYESYPR